MNNERCSERKDLEISERSLHALRDKIRKAWRIPDERGDLKVEKHGEVEGPFFRIIKLSYEAESVPLNRITANLYLPKDMTKERIPGVVMCMGHQGSKWVSPASQYGGQLIAYFGGACLVFDVIGEDERHREGKLHAQEHDMYDRKEWREGSPDNRAVATDYQLNVMKRPVSGKLVLDAMRSLDLLASRPEVDPQRLGVFGSSLGGQVAFWTTALDTRVEAGVVSGWALEDITDARQLRGRMACDQSGMRLAHKVEPRMEALMGLTATHARVMFINGDGEPWLDIASAKAVFDRAQPLVKDKQLWRLMPSGAGKHHHHELSVPGLAFLSEILDFPKITRDEIERMPTIEYGLWCDNNIPKELISENIVRIWPMHRGLLMPRIPAVWYPREKLACLGVGSAGPDYTFVGWRERCVALGRK